MGGFFSQLEIWEGEFSDFSEVVDIYNALMSIVCVVCAGLAAGLTMGLLSLDTTKLEIKRMTGTVHEKAAAESILPIVRQHHLLLVTLLLFNSMATEALPIFLGALVPNYLAVIFSVILVLFFGEIIPSAFFTGPQQLLTAAKMTPFVWGLLAFFWPISYPIAKVLDKFFGDEEDDTKISREDLRALMMLQTRGESCSSNLSSLADREQATEDETGSNKSSNSKSKRNSSAKELLLRNDSQGQSQSVSAAASAGGKYQSVKDGVEEDEDRLDQYEVNIMTGILKLSKSYIRDTMIEIDKVFALSNLVQLDQPCLQQIVASGFSRIPVFKQEMPTSPSLSRSGSREGLARILSSPETTFSSSNNTATSNRTWKGYFLVKSLIGTTKLRVDDLPLREPLFVRPRTHLLEMLNMFREGQCHMAMVSDDPMASLECMRAGTPFLGFARIKGIVTLEDVIEQIIQDDLLDETDVSAFGAANDDVTQRFPHGGAPTVMYHLASGYRGKQNSHHNGLRQSQGGVARPSRSESVPRRKEEKSFE